MDINTIPLYPEEVSRSRRMTRQEWLQEARKILNKHEPDFVGAVGDAKRLRSALVVPIAKEDQNTRLTKLMATYAKWSGVVFAIMDQKEE